MPSASLRKELEKKFGKFESEAMVSESLWSVFSEVVNGNNFVTAIAKKLKKNKSLVSRQLRRLADLDLVEASVPGVKQFYQVDWVTFTFYWIWEIEIFYTIIDFVPEIFELSKLTPKWASDLHLSPEESREANKTNLKVSDILEPVIPQLSQVVKLAVEPLYGSKDATTFWDAFYEVAKAFGISIAELHPLIKPTEIDIQHSRELIEAIFQPRFRALLKTIVLADLASTNVVRNYLLRLAGLLKG